MKKDKEIEMNRYEMEFFSEHGQVTPEFEIPCKFKIQHIAKKKNIYRLKVKDIFYRLFPNGSEKPIKDVNLVEDQKGNTILEFVSEEYEED